MVRPDVAAWSATQTARPVHRQVASSPDEVPWRFERGTSPFAQYAGLAAAVEHLAGLAPGEATGRRARLVTSLSAVRRHEQALFGRLLDGLAGLPHVHRIGAPLDPAPTLWFTVDPAAARSQGTAPGRCERWSGTTTPGSGGLSGSGTVYERGARGVLLHDDRTRPLLQALEI